MAEKSATAIGFPSEQAAGIPQIAYAGATDHRGSQCPSGRPVRRAVGVPRDRGRLVLRPRPRRVQSGPSRGGLSPGDPRTSPVEFRRPSGCTPGVWKTNRTWSTRSRSATHCWATPGACCVQLRDPWQLARVLSRAAAAVSSVLSGNHPRSASAGGCSNRSGVAAACEFAGMIPSPQPCSPQQSPGRGGTRSDMLLQLLQKS